MARAFALALLLMTTSAMTAAVSTAAAPRSSLRVTATGEIRRLDPHKIGVGHIVCAIPTKLARSAGGFVIGDPVRLTCLGGKLAGVTYSPEVAANQTSKAVTGNAPTTVTTPTSVPQSSCGLSCAKSVIYSVGTAFEGGPPRGDTSTATGTISDISDGSITAGGLTCSFNSLFDDLFNQAARVGDDVTLTCTGGVFVGMRSVGSVSR